MSAKASAARVAWDQETLDKEWATASDKAIAGSARLRPFLHMAARTGWLQAETSAARTVLSVEIGAGFRSQVAAADPAEVVAAFVEAAADVAVADAADSRD